MERKRIMEYIKFHKQLASSCYSRGKYEDALVAVSCCAQILYETNVYYTDKHLENLLKKISRIITFDDSMEYSRDVVLFWDGFGLDSRGLAQIYLRALAKSAKRVIYVTYNDRKSRIPHILDILKKTNGQAFFIKRKPKLRAINQLKEIVEETKAGHFFHYSTPDDVIGTTVMYAMGRKIKKCLINLTDQAFWLGSGCIDRCIEFREYGANISKDYRGIEKQKLVKIPFYPNIDKKQKFEGYPFTLQEGQHVVFSGGSLYKTLGGGNKYYRIVDYILNNYPNIIFWYAGSGDRREMDKLIRKYPKRAFLTAERKDLYQVLQHCLFYLNTYPSIGGLMTQYAVLAGKIPIILKYDNEADGVLINQENLGIQFENERDLYAEIDCLINNSSYLDEKSKKLQDSVISTECFEQEIFKLLSDEKGSYPIQYSYIDTTYFRQTYLNRITEKELKGIIARKTTIRLLKYEPFQFVAGVIFKIIGN